MVMVWVAISLKPMSCYTFIQITIKRAYVILRAKYPLYPSPIQPLSFGADLGGQSDDL